MDDADYFSFAANENHVERNRRVLHPERIYFLGWKNKQHAAIERQLAPIHQANLALLRSGGDLNVKIDLTFCGFNDHFGLRMASYRSC
jgi:hypothetical protein